MDDNTCIVCGAIIPEGRHICLNCEHGNDMQTFRKQIRTNGDLIRSMNNHDLANMIARLIDLNCFGETALFNWLESEVGND